MITAILWMVALAASCLVVSFAMYGFLVAAGDLEQHLIWRFDWTVIAVPGIFYLGVLHERCRQMTDPIAERAARGA